MSKKDQEIIARRSLVTGMGMAAAAAGLAVAAAPATAQSGTSGFQATRHAQDAWLDEMSGGHRIFVDTATSAGGIDALVYANNLLNAQENAYGGKASDLAMVICYRHFSTPFAFNDAMWEKYGEIFVPLMQFTDPTTGGTPTVNLMNQPNRPELPNFGNTLDGLGERGVRYAICAAATQFVASQISANRDISIEAARDELMANAIPNSRFVPAGVVALTRAQEYGYSLLVAG